MNKIEHFNLPIHTNTLHENEAISSISLTRDIADKINEIIDSLNTLSVTNLAKIQEQDGAIRKGILYMKDNLFNTLYDLTECLKARGYFTETIAEYTSELEKRLSNAISGVTTDSELLDIRVGADGVVYKTAGEAVRTLTKNLANYFDVLGKIFTDNGCIEDTENISVTFTTGKFINPAGSLEAINNPAWVVSQKINAVQGDIIRFSCASYAKNKACAFYDKSNRYLGGIDGKDLVWNEYIDKDMIAPTNTAYCLVSHKTDYLPKIDFKVQKIKRVGLLSNSIKEYLDNLKDYISLGNYSLSDNIEFAVINNYVLDEKCYPLPMGNDTTNTYNISDKISIVAGKFYYIQAMTGYDKQAYVIYDANDKPIANHQMGSKVESFSQMIVAPFNASYIRLAGYKTDDTMRIAECIPSNNKDSKLLSGKKWVAVGDSITEYNQRATKNYLTYIAEETGIEVINRGRSGSGFKRTDNEGFAFYQTISSIPESDVITIMASGNDMSAGVELGSVTDTATSTLCGCINTTLTNLFNKYPLARVGVITSIPWGSYNPANDNAMKRYANSIVEICKNRGIPCLDLYHSSGLRPWETSYLNLCYTRDEGNNVHPDENGHAVIYPQIREFIKKLL